MKDITVKTLAIKTLATFCIVSGWKYISIMMNAKASAASGAASVLQFNDSTSDAVTSSFLMLLYSNLSGGSIIIPVILILLVWKKEIVSLF